MTALVLAALAPAASAVDWGYDVDGVLFSRVGTGLGPAPGANPGTVGDLAGEDTRYITPGANEISVRAFVSDRYGERVAGVAVTGHVLVERERTDLRFSQVMTPDGDLVYDSQRIGYASGDADVALAFDFDRNGVVDARLAFVYHEV